MATKDKTPMEPQQKKKGVNKVAVVAIGAGAAVMLGEAAAFGAPHVIDYVKNQFGTAEEEAEVVTGNPGTGEDENENVEVETLLGEHYGEMATTVNEQMSFEDAFNAAREELGPGGIFQWHGHVYSTFTADEWESMSPEEQETYMDIVSGDAIDYAYDHPVHNEPAADNDDVTILDVNPLDIAHELDNESVEVTEQVEGEELIVEVDDNSVEEVGLADLDDEVDDEDNDAADTGDDYYDTGDMDMSFDMTTDVEPDDGGLF